MRNQLLAASDQININPQNIKFRNWIDGHSIAIRETISQNIMGHRSRRRRRHKHAETRTKWWYFTRRRQLALVAHVCVCVSAARASQLHVHKYHIMWSTFSIGHSVVVHRSVVSMHMNNINCTFWCQNKFDIFCQVVRPIWTAQRQKKKKEWKKGLWRVREEKSWRRRRRSRRNAKRDMNDQSENNDISNKPKWRPKRRKRSKCDLKERIM